MPAPLYRHAAIALGAIVVVAAVFTASAARGQTEVKPAPAAAKAEQPRWDVNNPPGPRHEAAIDVDEGTWVNVDVSPDGREIVFDLLGDLYTIPLAGGEARQLTSGIAWDMQARYSPDGKRIAFTSDRTGEAQPKEARGNGDGKPESGKEEGAGAGGRGVGGDNIWVIDRDGSHPVQVTKESFRLLNSPCWAPDSEYIAARKHFTSRRSLGAGEIWLYHRTGGEGLQLTTRPTEQKDVGEPAFSPDGRYLYYSLDATPGPNFEYSKDSNTGIYAIDRLDRVKGETERYISGPGGAIRPTPSPDGKTLAFIRRDRFKTCLFIQDIASGKLRKLTDTLERDMQETWAVHGVYPTMAWTPDGVWIVFWSGGKIRKVEVVSGGVSEIPFHVKTTRTMTETVRFPVEVAPDEFEVRMLQSVVVSPVGDQVAYQALGHIYIRPLPDGTARRLTSQDNHFEFFPSYSRDGKWIVYTTWNDDDLGTIRIAPSAGGEGRVVTPDPGHYVDPAMSPDGATVVFGRVSGGYLTSPLWGREPGLYRVPTAGGAMTLVSRKGTKPQFGAESDRVYVTTVEELKDNDRRCLISMRVDGGGEDRTHLVSENATEFRVSPDGKWVAYAERFNVYIAPFVPTGREVSIGPKTRSIPIAKATHEAGQNLQWSGDSTRLHWSLGPELFTRALTEAFAFLEGAPERPPEPPSSGINISFRAKAEKPSGTVALVGATVITMNGDEVLQDTTIIIKDNRIVAVGPHWTTPVPQDCKAIGMTDMTIMPGIIDVHEHGPQAENGITPEKNWGQYANIAFGVTTVHDPSNDTQAIFAASELARAGLVIQPRTFSTGTILYGAAGTARAEIESLEDARFHLRRMKAVGAISVKSYNQPRRDQRQMVIAAARELGMMVVPEGGSLLEHNLTMVVDGHTGVEHSLPVENVYSDVTQLWGASGQGGGGTGYTPTLIVGYGGIFGENYWYDKSNVWENERLLRYVPRFVVDPRSRRRVKAPDEEYNTLRSSRICKSIVDAGGRVQLGAHGQLAGVGAHWELWMIAGGGLTPLQAIRAATLDGARYLGMDHDLGSIEVGKLADLVILNASPLEDITNSWEVAYTVLNGRIYDAETMARLTGDPLARPHFFFEDLQGGAGMRGMVSGCAGCGVAGAGCSAERTAPGGAYR